MEALLLNANEAILRKSSCNIRYREKNAELFLSNQNLIVCHGNPKKKNAEVVKIKLSDISMNGTNPQIAVIIGEDGSNALTVFTDKCVHQILFENRSEANAWQKSIVRAMIGDIDVYTESENDTQSLRDAEKRATAGGFLSRTIFGVTKSIGSAVRSGYDGIKNGLGIQEKSGAQGEKARFGASILMRRSREQSNEQQKEQERIERAKRAMEYERQAGEEDNFHTEISQKEASAQKSIFCTECGEKLPLTAKFCHSCGTKIDQ